MRLLSRIYNICEQNCLTDGFAVIDIESGKIQVLTDSKIIEYLEAGNTLDNVAYNSKRDSMIGTEGNLNRLPKFRRVKTADGWSTLPMDRKSMNTIAILEKGIKKGVVTYKILSYTGGISYITEDKLHESIIKFGLSICNARVTVRDDGKVIVRPMKHKFKELSVK